VINVARFTVLLRAVSALEVQSEGARSVQRNLVRGAMLCLPLALAIPLAEPLIRAVYGAAFAEAAPIMLVLLMSVALDVVTTPLTMLAFPLNESRVLAASEVVRVITLTLAAMLLIPLLGPIGAAWAKLLAKAAGVAFTLAVLQRLAARHQCDSPAP